MTDLEMYKNRERVKKKTHKTDNRTKIFKIYIKMRKKENKMNI